MLKKMKGFLQRKEITVEQARQLQDLSQERDLKGELANFDPLIYKNFQEKQFLDQEYLDALDRSGVRPEIMDDRGQFIDPRFIAQMRNGVPVSSQPNEDSPGYVYWVQKQVMERLAQEKDRMGNIEQKGRVTNGNDKLQVPLGTRLKQMFFKKKK